MRTVVITVVSFFIVIFTFQAAIVFAGVLSVGLFLYILWIKMKTDILRKKLHKKHNE